MKSVKIIFIGLMLLSLTGCAMTDTMLTNRYYTEGTVTYNLTVDSTPANALVYVNDRLIGKTPTKIPLLVNYRYTHYAINGTYSGQAQQQFVLRLEKEGYEDIIEPIKFESKNYASGGWGDNWMEKPEKTEYHFKLEPKLESKMLGN